MSATTWHLGRVTLDLSEPRIMGILNVTPDSFSDGGAYASIDAAVDRGLEMVDDGADVIDVGGESTRPGAERVDADEQVRRVVPIVEGLRRRSDVAISVDTTRADVARAALDAGADAINDVAAGTEDPHVFDLAAGRGCGLVLMHRRLPPDRDDYSDRYAEPPADPDVTGTVRAFLAERLDAARGRGVDDAAVLLDPGLGFGKTVAQNYRLVRETPRLLELGRPILSAGSRKSFIGAVTGEYDPARRALGSIALALAHFAAGARIFRVHDVAEHRTALAVAAAVARTTPPSPATMSVQPKESPDGQ